MDNKGQMVTIFFSLFLILAVITILGIESANLNTNENVNSLIQAYNMPKLQYYFFLNTLSNVNSLTISNSTYGIVYSTLQKVYLNELQNINVSAVSLNTSNIVMQLPKKPTNIISYIPVTIFNLQNQATPYPFQQMVNANYSVYGNYSNAELSNIEFFYFNGTVIPSWLESNTGQYAVWWIKVGSIPASSSFTVYMGFARKNVSLFNKVTIGEAPELSPGYGEYDNGANVFPFYINGTSISGLSPIDGNSITKQSTSGPSGFPTQNYIYVNGSGSTSTYNVGAVIYDKTMPYNNNYIIEGWGYLNNANNAYPDTQSNVMFAVDANGYTTGSTFYADGDGCGGKEASIQYVTGGCLASSGSLSAGWFWLKETILPSEMIADTYNKPPSIGGNLLASTSYSISTSNPYVGLSTWNGATGGVYYALGFVRAYPPNGIMPTVGFGSDLP